VQVTYVGTGRNRFQLEVPEERAGKADDGHELVGQRKGYRRFVTEETKNFLAKEMKAEDEMESALQDIGRRIMSKFDSQYVRKSLEVTFMLPWIMFGAVT
jgi:DNA mismatch repair protein MSH6